MQKLQNCLFRLTCSFLLALFLQSVSEGQTLQAGRSFRMGDCYAKLDGTILTVGNSHVRRSWNIERGELFATSLFDVDQKIEWINVPSKLPSPSPPQRTGGSGAVFRGSVGVFTPTEAMSLRAELEVTNAGAQVRYEFQIFSNSPGVRIWVESKQASAASLSPERNSESFPFASEDVLERLQISQPHLKLTQVTLRDRTDERNELVFENEWLLHPNESLLELSGNIFFLENPITGDGLLFLKEAPQPEMRPIQNPFDLRFTGLEMTERSVGKPKPTFFDVAFYGHGYSETGKGYPYSLMVYHGGRQGRIAAIHLYQRQIRKYVTSRDGQLLSNTWGDRAVDAKLNERFIRGEIEAGHQLGVEIVQIDAGWQLGQTMGMKGAGEAGIWQGFWAKNSKFWSTDSVKFPSGIGALAEYARERKMKLGLWFAPDSAHEFENWQRDAMLIGTRYREDHVQAFKFDAVKILSKTGETNYRSFLDKVLEDSSAKVSLDLDVTAETRQGYFGDIAAGTLFLENRYSDWHRYWPHQTLRNFWKLAQYVDPVRLRVEFLNPERNAPLYTNDPLAPMRYRPSALFATTMFASPLAWFENTGLSRDFIADAAPVIARWKDERSLMNEGTVIPIGDAPDGVAWTGFASADTNRSGGYLLVFRELNGSPHWELPQAPFDRGHYRFRLLGGEGTVTAAADIFQVEIPKPLGFVWVKVEKVP